MSVKIKIRNKKGMKDMSAYHEKKFDWCSFIIGILMTGVALFSFRTPITNLAAIVIVFAFSAIVKGIIQLIGHSQLKHFTYYQSKRLVFLGVINIIIGIFLLFNMTSSIVALPFVFSIWFIIESVGELLLASIYRDISKSYFWLMIISSALSIILGFILLSEPLIAALSISWLVGTYFLIAGILYIVRSF